MFIHKDYQRQGIASALLQRIEAYAAEHGISEVTSEVSITARPFFEKQGYIVELEQRAQANRLQLINYKMRKQMKDGNTGFEKVYQMPLGKVYPLLVNKATRKGRTQEEVDEIICWLTGYNLQQLKELLDQPITYGDFFSCSQPCPQTDKRKHLRHSGGRNPGTADAGNPLSGQAGGRAGQRQTNGQDFKKPITDINHE